LSTIHSQTATSVTRRLILTCVVADTNEYVRSAYEYGVHTAVVRLATEAKAVELAGMVALSVGTESIRGATFTTATTTVALAVYRPTLVTCTETLTVHGPAGYVSERSTSSAPPGTLRATLTCSQAQQE
jgi:hypothetical protein